MAESDKVLVLRSLEGDREAFEELVRRYQQFVFSVLYHYFGRDNIVEDLAQEVFLRFYETLDRYDTDRPLKHWIGRIASNRSIDELRKRKRSKVQLMSDFEQRETARELLEANPGTTLTESQSERAWSLLQAALSRLSQSERSAFVMYELQDMDYPDVAKTLGTSQVAARIRVSRARRKLQHDLEGLLDEA